MKKVIIILMALIPGIMFACTSAFAAGTESNWSLKLTLTSGSKADPLPIVVGESQISEEVLKPPALPGKSVTGSDDDAIINGSARVSGSRKAATTIDTAPTSSDDVGKVWAIDVDAESTGEDVNLTLDTTNARPGYAVSVIVPDQTDPSKKVVKFGSSSPATQTLFKSDGNPKTIYLRVGKSQTFMVKQGADLVGLATVNGNMFESDVEVKVDGASTIAKTDANGLFTLAGVNPGTNTMLISKKYHLSRKCSLAVDQSGFGSAACPDITAGDTSSDGKINIIDLGQVALCFGTSFDNQTVEANGKTKKYDEKCDVNGDKKVTIVDLGLIKLGLGKQSDK